MKPQDVVRLAENTAQNLEKFYTTLETPTVVEDAHIEVLLNDLQKNSNDLARMMHDSEVSQLDLLVKNKILSGIQAIQYSHSYVQMVGAYQMRLMNILKRIKQVVSKWETKVTKTSKGELGKQSR